MSWQAWLWVHWPDVVAFTVAALVGGAGIPALIYMLDKGYPDVLSGITQKLYWVAGALAYGRYIAYERDNQSYELLAAEPCTDEDGDPAHKIWPDGPKNDPVVVKGGIEEMYRLGLRPFGVAAAKTDRQMQRFGAEKRVPGEAAGGQASTDGGGIELNEKRQGYWAFDHTRGETGWVLPLRRKANELQDSAGSNLFLRSMMDAIVKEGGQKRLEPWMLYGLGFLCLLTGGVMSFLTMWVIA